jgi:hypothetical protein
MDRDRALIAGTTAAGCRWYINDRVLAERFMDKLLGDADAEVLEKKLSMKGSLRAMEGEKDLKLKAPSGGVARTRQQTANFAKVQEERTARLEMEKAETADRLEQERAETAAKLEKAELEQETADMLASKLELGAMLEQVQVAMAEMAAKFEKEKQETAARFEQEKQETAARLEKETLMNAEKSAKLESEKEELAQKLLEQTSMIELQRRQAKLDNDMIIMGTISCEGKGDDKMGEDRTNKTSETKDKTDYWPQLREKKYDKRTMRKISDYQDARHFEFVGKEVYDWAVENFG